MASKIYFNHIIYLLVAMVAVWAASCARSYNPNIERGSTYTFKRGHPDLRFTAVGFVNEQNESFLNLAAEVVYGSVFYKRKGDKREANLVIEYIITDQENGDEIIQSKRLSFNQIVKTSLTTSQKKVFKFNKNVAVEAGNYEVRLTVIDQHTNHRTTQISTTTIPKIGKTTSSLTNIRLLEKNGDTWSPVTTYNIPGRTDSLTFIIRVNNTSDSLFSINTRLIKFEADTSAAAPMHTANYSPSDIAYKGIDYDERDIIKTSGRKLSKKGAVTFDFKFGRLPKGNYRFKVDAGRGEELNFKGRDFAIRSSNYPTIITAKELARPLIYLMDEDEYEALMTINNSDSLKQAIDRFWLKIGGHWSDAQSILRLYYKRVEEANKKFSNFKEGWKTDRGMIYILFGPPWFVLEARENLSWSYTYNQSDQDYNFDFIKARTKSEYYPFDYYRLQRELYYFQRQYYQLQLWLTGSILVRRL
jgi:GWxTD domain-containing protein